MKIQLFVVCSVLVLTGIGQPVAAELFTLDDVPAATLLLPYFEVELDDPDGVTTLFSINNAAAEPIVAHVTFWSDLSAHTLDFNIYLTGYDVATVNLRDVFEGRVPQTAVPSEDPADTISPEGPLSGDNDLPGCGTTNPPGEMSPLRLAHTRAAHTGQISPAFGDCAGFDHGDNVARGYITIDAARECTLQFPGDAGYFVAGGQGAASNDNVLWGDYFIIDPSNELAQGRPLVHIEACDYDSEELCPLSFDPPAFTFYGRYVNYEGQDEREPLPTTWATRYLSGGTFVGGTDLIVWRDARIPLFGTGYVCGTDPPWFPLNESQVVAFNETEDAVALCQFGPDNFSPPIFEDPTCFPFEAGRYRVGIEPLIPPFAFGWIYLDLNTNVTGTVFFENITQSWVGTALSGDGRYSVGFDAIALDNAYFTSGGD